MRKNYFTPIACLLWGILGVVSCTSPVNPPTVKGCVFNLDDLPKTDTLLWSSFFSSEVQVFALDTVSQALIGSIDKMKQCDDYIVLLDRNVARRVLVFNKEGKYLHGIGQYGTGKGEYVRPMDFTYNPERRLVYILDSARRLIQVYNIADGSYLYSVSAEKNCCYLQYFDGYLYLNYASFSEDELKSLVVQVDPDTGEPVAEFLSPVENNLGWNKALTNYGGPFLTSNGRKLYYTHLFMNTVYSKQGDDLSPFVTLESRDWMEQEDIEGLNPDRNYQDLAKIREKNRFYNIHDFFIHKKKVFCTLMQGMQFQYLVLDLAAKQGLKARVLIEDRLWRGVNQSYTNLHIGDKTDKGVYMYLQPDYLRHIIDLEEQESLEGKARLSLIKALHENFNGAIVYYEFKE